MYFSILVLIFVIIIYVGIYASDSVFSGRIVMTLFFNILIPYKILIFNLSGESTETFYGFGYFKFKVIRDFAMSFYIITKLII